MTKYPYLTKILQKEFKRNYNILTLEANSD